MNKKGFSLVELLAVIAIMGILSGICILAVTRYISNSKKKTYKNFEENLRGAAVNYLSSHTELSTVSGGVTLTYSTLVEGQYLEELKDPGNQSKKCDASYVKVTGTRDSATSYNISFTYKVCLICPSYKSPGC